MRPTRLLFQLATHRQGGACLFTPSARTRASSSCWWRLLRCDNPARVQRAESDGREPPGPAERVSLHRRATSSTSRNFGKHPARICVHDLFRGVAPFLDSRLLPRRNPRLDLRLEDGKLILAVAADGGCVSLQYDAQVRGPEPDLRSHLVANLDQGTLDADSLLAGYCALLHQRHGTIEEVARRANLDRRTPNGSRLLVRRGLGMLHSRSGERLLSLLRRQS